MEDFDWHIPNEARILDRLEELYSYLQNFPNSELSPIFQREINYLETLL